jgi:hypothetical protein
VPRWAALDEQLGQGRQHVVRAQPARRDDGQALPAVLVDHDQQAELAPVVGPLLDEVVGPDVVRPLRPQPDT